MKNILKNFVDASDGKTNSSSAQSSNEMKKILESFKVVEDCGTTMPDTTPEPDKVNMNVNISAQGEDGIEQLIKIMAGASAPQDAPVRPMPSGAAFDRDDDMEIEIPAKDQEMDMATMRRIMSDEESADVEEDWDNAPDEGYRDHEYMTKDLSGGLNREKKSYKAAQDGDNAMAVETLKAELSARLREKMDYSKK